jgi:putative spermidine/putrescine transport system permease protein
VLRLLQCFQAIPPFVGLMLVHVVLIALLSLMILRAALESLDIRLEDAAARLGASPLQVFVLAMVPALFAQAAVAFLVSFGGVTVKAFLTTARMLPLRVHADVQSDVQATVNVISVLTIAVTVLVLAAVNPIVGLDRAWRR